MFEPLVFTGGVVVGSGVTWNVLRRLFAKPDVLVTSKRNAKYHPEQGILAR